MKIGIFNLKKIKKKENILMINFKLKFFNINFYLIII